ncbi:MAG TPA: hypothetical protein VIT45_17485 [Allosphingosinicella sp.]
MKKGVITAAALALAAPAFAQAVDDAENPVRTQVVPIVGVERTVSVGEPVFQTFHYRRLTLATIAIPLSWGKARNPLPAGTILNHVKWRKGPFKACNIETNRCASDVDGDGKFDRGSLFNVGDFIPLNAPVPYTKADVDVPLTTDPFKATILYTGATSDSLRLSYREFANDMARAAFTEDLTIPITKTFPQLVAFKGIRMKVLSIDGLGMRYVIEGMQPLTPTAPPAPVTSTAQ